MATYYINADTGNDTIGDGSQGNPWLTIDYAVSQIGATDTATIVAQDSVNHYSFTTLSFGSRIITLQGESIGGAIFDANNVINQTWSGLKYADLCDFTGANLDGTYKGMFFGTLNHSNCRYYGNIFDNSRSGIAQGSGVHTFTSCLMYNNTNIGSGGGLFGRNDGNVVENKLINCVVYFDNIMGSLWGNSNGDNTNTLKNTILYNSLGNSIELTNDVTYMDYCCYYGLFSGIPSGTGNINQDPLFVDAATYNFQLSPSSPCIDAGTLV